MDLELAPLFRFFENVNMRFHIARWWILLQLFDNHTVVELGFDRDRRCHVTVDVMIDEMLGLGVLPLVRLNRERNFAKRIGVALANLIGGLLGERAKGAGLLGA